MRALADMTLLCFFVLLCACALAGCNEEQEQCETKVEYMMEDGAVCTIKYQFDSGVEFRNCRNEMMSLPREGETLTYMNQEKVREVVIKRCRGINE